MSQNAPSPCFDRSLLPPAQFEFIVIGDTHYMLHPEAYAPEFDSARHWSARADRALQLAAALNVPLVIHLGDLAQEFPEKPDYEQARAAALAQFEQHGLKPRQVAGNMDIGDKPDPTMPSEWVTPHTLAQFHEQFGRSWYSFEAHGAHFVVLNTQIMNGPLPEADAQRAWMEADLAEHAGERLFVFLHMPIFFVEEHEPDQGFYNSIDEPARGWLLGLLRQYRAEAVFSGHTHFAAFNRVGDTRLYVSPSTTTSRAGFYEAFSVRPETEQGRNDTPKLGFYLVRAYAGRTAAHFTRTHGETGPGPEEADGCRLVTRISSELPKSPLGVYLRTPLARVAEGAIAYPGVIRQRVRDDHPFLATLELGARHVRFPISDLEDRVQGERLCHLRDEGVALTAVWILYDRLRLAEAAQAHAGALDYVEAQLPGVVWPEAAHLEAIRQFKAASDLPLTLAALLTRVPTAGKFHPRQRIGYRAEEMAELDGRLAEAGVRVDRALAHVGPDEAPFEALQKFGALPPLPQLTGFDFVIGLPGTDEEQQARRAAEAVFAAALVPGSRVFLDPLIDLDRTNDINHGLLDRLSNPRPAFHAARCLNTLMFAEGGGRKPLANQAVPGGRVLGLEGEAGRDWLLLPDMGEAIDLAAMADWLAGGKGAITRYDLVAGRSQQLATTKGESISGQAQRPTLVRQAAPRPS